MFSQKSDKEKERKKSRVWLSCFVVAAIFILAIIILGYFLWLRPAREAAREDVDPDRDGLTNLLEEEIGTDPLSADSDGDGFLDGQELTAGYDPLTAAAADADQDLAGGIRTGEFDLPSGEDLAVLQTESESTEHWRLDPLEYLSREGQTKYGLSQTDQLKLVDLFREAGVALIKITRGPDSYLATVVQPAVGSDKIWSVRSIETEKP